MPSAALPKAFGFEESKGYFPHLFNTQDNQNYIGPLPDSKFYSPDTMSEGGRKKFFEWYNDTKESYFLFNFRKEILKYCVMDVTLLRKACLKFLELVREVGKVNPFTESCTIASMCSRVFPKNFLEPESLGIMPRNGYRLADNQLAKAVRWLLLRETEDGEIVHAGRWREHRLLENIIVDGYREGEGGERYVYQFHGCWYHACPRCFDAHRSFADDATRQEMRLRYE